MPEAVIRSQIRIFDDPIHPFVDFPRKVGYSFAVLVFRDVPEQWTVAVFGDYPLSVRDQPFHNLRVQWHIPVLVALDRTARLPVFFTDKQEPFSRYHLFEIAIVYKIEI